MIFKILSDLKKSYLLDDNEKYFIKNIKKNQKDKNYSNKAIFINVAMDYFHLAQTSFLLQDKKYENHNIIGIWNYNITPNWKNKNYFLEKSISLKNTLKFFFLKKKWTKIYESIGVNQLIDTNKTSFFDKLKYKKKTDVVFNKIQNIQKDRFIKLKINNIIVGDLIIDTYIRFRNIQTIDFNDYFLKNIVNKFIISQSEIYKAIMKFKPEFLILNFSNYSNGVIARTLLNKNIKVYCTGDTMSYLKRLTKNDPNTHTSYQHFKSLFKNTVFKKQKLNQSRIELKKRFSGLKDQAYSYMKKSPYRKNSKKMKLKTDGVLFLHDFFDTPHHFKSMFFFDFYEWAVFSLDIIEKYNLNIAVKPHPNSIYQNKVVIENLKKKFPNVKWIDPNISNAQIFNSGIRFGISIYGSVLYELAYHNLVPIASTPYHPTYNYNIVYTPQNKKEYKNLLLKSKNLRLKKNVKKKIEEFYYMWTFYNHDAIKKTARTLKLKSINFKKSNGLNVYLKRLTKFNKNNILR